MKIRYILAPIFIALLIIALLQIDRESLINSAKQVPIWLILTLTTLQITTQLLINLQWYKVAKLSGIKISFCNMLLVNCKGAVVDSITPGVKLGGEVTRAMQINKTADISFTKSAAVVALQKLFSLSTLFIILLFAIGYLAMQAQFLQAIQLQILTFGLLIFLLAIFLGVFIAPNKIKLYIENQKAPKRKYMQKFRKFLIALTEQIENIRKNKPSMLKLSLLSLFIWLLYPVKLYLITTQFYPNVNIILIASIAFAAYMVAMLPIFPGGIGGFEGTMSALLITANFTLSDAATITVIFRFVTFWFVLLFSLGFIALTFIKRRFARA